MTICVIKTEKTQRSHKTNNIVFLTALSLFSFFRAVGLYQAYFTSTPYVVCCEKLVCHTAAIVDVTFMSEVKSEYRNL